jgi:uncharacterized protein YxeA
MAQKKKKKIIIGIVIAAVVLAGAGAFVYYRSQDEKPLYFVNYDGPTEEEQAAADEQKEKNNARDDLENSYEDDPGTGQREVTVSISDAGQYDDMVEVRAAVSGVYEEGGSCTAVFEQNGQEVRVETVAFRDASTVQCGALDTPRGSFPAGGKWNVRVVYTSGTSQGTSDTRTIELH